MKKLKLALSKKSKFKPYVSKGKSWGEQCISRYLDKNNITYIYDSPSEVVNPYTGKKLRFDFYIPDKNLYIEYQGKQHYAYVPELHGLNKELGLAKLAGQKYKDSLKVQHCKEINAKLLIISYLQYKDIIFLLDKALNNL